MTNKSDLNKCCAQIEIVKQLITTPEDLDKVLVKLEDKKGLLMKYRPRDYATILKEILPEDISIQEANNVLAEKGEKVGPPEREKEPKKEVPKVKEIDQTAEIKRLKAELKKAKEEEEVKGIPGE